MRFEDPGVLFLLPLVAVYVWLRWPRRRPPRTHVTFPAISLFGGVQRVRAAWVRLPGALRAASLFLAIVAMARPQSVSREHEEAVRGRNLMLTLDVSSSMRAEDFRPNNRLQVAKRLLAEFVLRREGDLMGLVVFAGKPFTQVPLTTETDVLLRMLEQAEVGMLPDGTGIGTALAASLDHLSELPPGSSAVVLITDGINNAGRVDPLTAGEAARALGIRVYTVGVSERRRGFVEAWRGALLRDRQSTGGVDEEVLKRIADRTGGRYYRATDPDALARILRDIDRLEKTAIRSDRTAAYDEVYAYFLGPALALFALDLLLRATWLRTLP